MYPGKIDVPECRVTLQERNKKSLIKSYAKEPLPYLDVPGSWDQWLVNGVYWGYNPLTNLLLTSWDILVVYQNPPVITCEASVWTPLLQEGPT